jgi:hypothetical protein
MLDAPWAGWSEGEKFEGRLAASALGSEGEGVDNRMPSEPARNDGVPAGGDEGATGVCIFRIGSGDGSA